MYHHYIQKGFTFEYLSSMPYDERLFMMASMEQHFEEEQARWGTT